MRDAGRVIVLLSVGPSFRFCSYLATAALGKYEQVTAATEATALEWTWTVFGGDRSVLIHFHVLHWRRVSFVPKYEQALSGWWIVWSAQYAQKGLINAEGTKGIDYYRPAQI